MGSRSVGRSLKTANAVLFVLKKMTSTDEDLTTGQVADLIGKSGATATYLLNSLVAEGFARRLSNGQYRLVNPLTTGGRSQRRSPAENLTIAAEELYARTRERTYIGLMEDESVAIRGTWGRQGQPLVPGLIGEARGAAHALAIGKSLLAQAETDEVLSYVDRYRLTRFTSATITDPDILCQELAEVALRGVAINDGEFVVGFTCIAAPVFDRESNLLGAIAVSVSSAKYKHQGSGLIQTVEQTARQASQQPKLLEAVNA